VLHDVEIETAAIENFTLPLGTAVDRVAAAVRDDRKLIGGDAAGRTADRTLLVSASVEAGSAVAALQLAVERLQHHFQRCELGPLEIRSLRCGPHRAADTDHRHAPAHVAPPAPAAAGNGAWPPQFSSRHAPAAVPQRAADTARLWADAHAIARTLTSHGHPDHGRAIEHALRPGRPIGDSIFHLRHELIQLRMTEAPILLDIEGPLDSLIAAASRALGAPAGR
jgi:hypothetical protein